MLTLIEKAKDAFDEAEATEAANRMLEGTFTLEDFLDQMQQVKKMGPIGGLMGMLPGMPAELRNTKIEDSEVARLEAIIRSMTLEERRNPDLIDGSRKLRIANGSGSSTPEVNQLLRQFAEVQRMMKRFGVGAGGKRTKKSKKRKGGGRVTPAGGAKAGKPSKTKTELKLPGLP